ncbi:hypothetical protein E4T42_07494 [Aureobasidium subglaciale]|nr:hypothetical protein E4T42_07494 [Aureobasidium subglaciale]
MVAVDVAQAYAEGRLPTNISYITPEYLSESRDGPAIAGILAIYIITTVLLICRFASRIFIVKSFGLDDGIAAFSWACFSAFMALCLILIYEGSGRHIEYIQYVLSLSEVEQTEVNDYAAHLIYTATLYFCRLSGLAFFNRLCSSHPTFRIAIWACGFFLTATFIVQFLLILLHCLPVHIDLAKTDRNDLSTGLWPYAWQSVSGTYTCLNWGVVYVTNSSLSLVNDFVLFSIPIAMIAILQLPKGRKIVLSLVMLPGTLVIGISCARLWLCVVGQWRTDGSWYYNPQLVIEVAEIGGTLIALSVPSYKPILSRWYGQMKSTVEASHGPSSKYGAGVSNRKSSVPALWGPEAADSKMKTSVQSCGPSGASRDSSDDSLLTPDDNIYVTTDVNMRSIPMARIRKNSGWD